MSSIFLDCPTCGSSRIRSLKCHDHLTEDQDGCEEEFEYIQCLTCKTQIPRNLWNKILHDDYPKTIEEMEKKWPVLPPNQAGVIIVAREGYFGARLVQKINQDTIDEIVRYFKSAQEAMNG